MEGKKRIIVLQTFNNHIEANIIKTKLDAYGIPCFLSQENVTLLTTHLLSGGIRLHIFEEDQEQVVQLLTEEYIKAHEEDDLLKCPSCNSKRILDFSTKRFDPASLVKFILQLTKQHYCLDCEAEFNE